MIITILFSIVVYLSLYTWNAKHGTIDRLVSSTGLEAIGRVLQPGIWFETRVKELWFRYVYLVDVEAKNLKLNAELASLEEEIAVRKEQVEENKRLRSLLELEIPEKTVKIVARVIAIRYGAQAVVNSLLLNKGSTSGIQLHAPVVSTAGLVGRIIRVSAHNSVVLPITAPDSKFAIISQLGRVSGIIAGRGNGNPLSVLYVPRSTAIVENETLVTSGVDGIFPKGIPVAKVSSVQEEELFFSILAVPLVKNSLLEEVVVLAQPITEEGMQTIEENAS